MFFEPISVILPAKDASGTIRTAVLSTLQSMHFDDELIIVLDQTDDQTFSKIATIQDPRIQIHRLQGQQSLTKKLNFGMFQSRNAIIARMDADDICLPWRFNAQRTVIGRNSIQLVASTYIAFGTKLRPLPVLPQLPIPLETSDIVSLLVDTNPIAHPTVMFRKSSIIDVGGYRESVAEDLDLWLRVALAGHEIRRIAWPTVLYRFSRRSLSRQADFTSRVLADQELIRLRRELRKASSEFESVLSTLPKLRRMRNRVISKLVRLNLKLNN